jgi:hypothetical protein
MQFDMEAAEKTKMYLKNQMDRGAGYAAYYRDGQVAKGKIWCFGDAFTAASFCQQLSTAKAAFAYSPIKEMLSRLQQQHGFNNRSVEQWVRPDVKLHKANRIHQNGGKKLRR